MNTITRITATDLLKKRGEILRRCFIEKEHFIVENHGLPIVALVPFDEYKECVRFCDEKSAPSP